MKYIRSHARHLIFIGGIIVILILIGIFGLFFHYGHEEYVREEPKKTSSSLPQNAEATTTILFVGDVMLGRNVENLMTKYGDEYPFTKVSELLKSVDTVVANLEGPVLKDHIKTPSNSVRFAFDERMPSLLKAQNIGVVSLANNHTVDYGADGFVQTVQYLTAAGISYAGHPFSNDEKYILRKEINGTKFIFVAYNFTNPNFNQGDALGKVKSIQKTEDEMLIAMIHGGEEYQLISNTRQQTFYRGLIDAGVDLVIAHHPHVTQEVELYKNKHIFYSLGNFIFDQYFEKNVEQGLAVKMSVAGDNISYELIPIAGNHSQPKVMEGKEKDDFLKSLGSKIHY